MTGSQRQRAAQGQDLWINSQLDAVAEKLTQLPKTVSAKPIFLQMEKLEVGKKQLQEELDEVNRLGPVVWDEKPVDFETFERFAKSVRGVLDSTEPRARKALIRLMVKKIEISPTGIRIGFITSKDRYKRIPEAAVRASRESGSCEVLNFFATQGRGGSHSLTIGARKRT